MSTRRGALRKLTLPGSATKEDNESTRWPRPATRREVNAQG